MMSEIRAADVKALRDTTGAGMMECKNALKDTGGDMDAAVDLLRTKGLAAAAKKAGRVAAEGLIGMSVGGKAGALVEVNSETDFVARNEQFQAFVKTCANLALSNDGSLETVKGSGYPGAERTVGEELNGLIATIGENLGLRRSAALAVKTGVVASYMHNKAADDLGRIGVVVGLESDGDTKALEALGRQVAMHIAAAKPLALDQDGMDSDLVERERNVLRRQARESGKPDNIIEKMIEGRMRKFYAESVLLNQAFVMDPDRSIAQLLEDAEKDVGAAVTISAYIRYEIGEGIEKKEENFAAEVAKVAGL